MDTLLYALLIIGVIVAGIFAYEKASDFINKVTGRDLDNWIRVIFQSGFFLLIGYGGLRLVLYSMETKAAVLGVLIGLWIIAIAGFLIYASWADDGRPSWNPMSGKRAHYNKEGKLTGYSDKD